MQCDSHNMKRAGIPEGLHDSVRAAVEVGKIDFSKLLQALQQFGPILLQILAFLFQPVPTPTPMTSTEDEKPEEDSE